MHSTNPTPRVSDLSDSCLSAAADAAVAAGASAPRIVVIDDDESVRSLVVHFLEKQGYAPEGFPSGKAAFAWMRMNRCALVITDIMMSETDGLEVIQHLRRTDPGVKIVAISGGDSRGNNYLRAASQLGAANVIAKPFSLGDLAAAVRQILERA